MKTLFVPKETRPGESRTALTPVQVSALKALGLTVSVEAGVGQRSGYADDAYAQSGAVVVEERGSALAEADVVLRVREPELAEVGCLKRGSLQVGLLDPFRQPDLIKALAAAGVSAVSMEMLPRSTIAQKMDVLSSQANLAGYAAVLLAAGKLDRILPLMMTPAGTLAAARFFIIGVGVAGLQAIATAKRLGARVEAFDTRPVVEEQVKSLGAKFVKIDLGETGQTGQGYAAALTPEQLECQRAGMMKVLAQADVVITTAKLFGRPSPLLVTAEMLACMRSGALVVDLAAEAGGNVEGVEPGRETVTSGGVRLFGAGSLETTVPHHASFLLGNNLTHFVEHLHDKTTGAIRLDVSDPLLRECLITHGGAVVHERFRETTTG